MQTERQELETAAMDYWRAVAATKDATEGSGHWEARREMLRAEAELFAAASAFAAEEEQDRMTRRMIGARLGLVQGCQE